MTKETLGTFIAEHRKSKGLTQKELAEMLHVTDKAVSKWERGLSFPDVTLLEPLATALEMSVTELMTCRKSEQEGSVMTEETKNLLELSADSLQSERKKGWRRVTVLTILLACVLALLLAGYLSRFETQTRRETIFMKETVAGVNYIYVKENGHLLRLECGAGVDFDAITADDLRYELECRWNKKTYQGKVLSSKPTGEISLGGLMDAEFEILEAPLFGHETVYYRCENFYPDPYREPAGKAYLCDYRFWLWDRETEEQQDLLVIKDCIEATLADLDGDGEQEVVARTRWPEKPYTVYNWMDGEIVQTWPEAVPEDIKERLIAIWER